MRKQFHTPDGISERQLTKKEIKEFARMGDEEAKEELKREEYKMVTSLDKKVRILAEFLGIEDWIISEIQ